MIVSIFNKLWQIKVYWLDIYFAGYNPCDSCLHWDCCEGCMK